MRISSEVYQRAADRLLEFREPASPQTYFHANVWALELLGAAEALRHVERREARRHDGHNVGWMTNYCYDCDVPVALPIRSEEDKYETI